MLATAVPWRVVSSGFPLGREWSIRQRGRVGTSEPVKTAELLHARVGNQRCQNVFLVATDVCARQKRVARQASCASTACS